MLHRVEGIKQKCIPLALLNLAEDESIFLKRGEIFGSLEPSSIEIGEIIKEDWSGPVESNEKENTEIPLGIKQKCIPLALLNLAEDESIFLKRGEIFGSLEPSSIEIGEIM